MLCLTVKNPFSFDYPYRLRVNDVTYSFHYTTDSIRATIEAIKAKRINEHLVFKVIAETDTEYHIDEVIYKEEYHGQL